MTVPCIRRIFSLGVPPLIILLLFCKRAKISQAVSCGLHLTYKPSDGGQAAW
uniref:Uncharacterized protein n=1 Tax=Anguilla anguilla TaxID=7936 RepID=A0A0E9S3Q9_ANGAN